MFFSGMLTAPKATQLQPHVSSRNKHVEFEIMHFCTSAVAKRLAYTMRRIYILLKSLTGRHEVRAQGMPKWPDADLEGNVKNSSFSEHEAL